MNGPCWFGIHDWSDYERPTYVRHCLRCGRNETHRYVAREEGEITLKAPADDLCEAAERMRRELCYGGSGHEFFATVADWFEREAEQADRLVQPGMWGVADDLAVRAARAYMGRRGVA